MCAIHVQYMCNTCAVHVQYMCSTCAIHVQYMCNTCAVHVQYIQNHRASDWLKFTNIRKEVNGENNVSDKI